MVTRIAGQAHNSDKILTEFAEMSANNEILQEAWAEASAALLQMRAEDIGWAPLNRVNEDDGFSLEALQEIAELAELQTTGNPLLVNGLRLRTGNVFGKGVKFEFGDSTKNIAPRFQAVIDKPTNQNNLFTPNAFEKNERELYTKGNLFVAYRKSTKTFFPIPFDQISNFASNPDYKQDVWYYQRTYTKLDQNTLEPEREPTVEWYPVLERSIEGSLPKTLGRSPAAPVVSDIVIIDLRVNLPNGKVWGIPDALPAMPYAWAHSEYIKDASKLLKALATIAWKVVAKNKANAANAASKVTTPKRAGSTAVMTDGNDLVAMPRSGQVNMTDGQTIASYVASALGVSLIALLADPGTASGSYGAAATLDGPSANTARSRQNLWKTFYARVYRAIGMDGIEVVFPKIQEDPPFRQMQTLALARTTGGLWADEYREYILNLLDISGLHENAPPSSEFAQAQNALGFLQTTQQAEQAQQNAATASSPISGQGRSGAVGSLSSGDNSTRDNARTPGTGGKSGA